MNPAEPNTWGGGWSAENIHGCRPRPFASECRNGFHHFWSRTRQPTPSHPIPDLIDVSMASSTLLSYRLDSFSSPPKAVTVRIDEIASCHGRGRNFSFGKSSKLFSPDRSPRVERNGAPSQHVNRCKPVIKPCVVGEPFFFRRQGKPAQNPAPNSKQAFDTLKLARKRATRFVSRSIEKRQQETKSNRRHAPPTPTK